MQQKVCTGEETLAVVKSGKLYVVQVQIGLCLRAASPKQAGRVLEAMSNRGPR